MGLLGSVDCFLSTTFWFCFNKFVFTGVTGPNATILLHYLDLWPAAASIELLKSFIKTVGGVGTFISLINLILLRGTTAYFRLSHWSPQTQMKSLYLILTYVSSLINSPISSLAFFSVGAVSKHDYDIHF